MNFSNSQISSVEFVGPNKDDIKINLKTGITYMRSVSSIETDTFIRSFFTKDELEKILKKDISGFVSTSSYGSTGFGGSTSTYSSSSYGNSNFNSSKSYSYNTTHNMDPTLAFIADGISFYGSAKSNLTKFDFSGDELVINCTGAEWTTPPPKHFIKKQPAWLNIRDVYLSSQDPVDASKIAQLVFDWPDMNPPSADFKISDWKFIVDKAKSNNIKEIIVCCAAGQGRTGTALASLMLATETVRNPLLAIQNIRTVYSKEAIERKSQEDYIFKLVQK